MILELGVGLHPVHTESVKIDKCPESQARIIRDFVKRGIPFSDSVFHEVLMYDVLEHIEHYEDLVFTLNEIWRVLQPNGVFRFSTPNGVDNGFTHMTHHRVFLQGSFDYLGDNLSPEMEYMRKADGIKARFTMHWPQHEQPTVLQGEFYAIK